jgi:cytochrome P450
MHKAQQRGSPRADDVSRSRRQQVRQAAESGILLVPIGIFPTDTAYLPFGAGPRIGAAFALQEATLVLAAIAKNFRIELAPGATVWRLQRVTLRPIGGLPMTLAI